MAALPIQARATLFEVIAIRRGDRHLKPTDDLTLQAGDILILFRPSSHLDAAEEVLVVGGDVG